MKLRISKLKLLILVLMSIIGLAASVEVIITFYTLHQLPPLCGGGSIFGIRLDCGAVLGSQYSDIYGVPLEFLAVAYFIVNLSLVYLIAFGSDRISHRSLRALFGWRFIGIILVPYLVFIEVVLIKAICIYCTIMHVAIVADFIIISYLLFLRPSDSLGIGPMPGSIARELPPVDQT
jgi:uncharacterized membrane protein